MSTEGHSRPNDIEQLKAMIAAQSIALAQRETVIESQHDIIEKQLKKLAAQKLRLARLLRRQYGPQKERVDPDQLTLFTSEELVELVTKLQQGVVDSVSPDDGTRGGLRGRRLLDCGVRRKSRHGRDTDAV